MRVVAGAALVLLAVLSATGCSDPAVKLAYCLEAGSRKLAKADRAEISRNCNLGLDGRYVVVLFPAEDLTDGDLRRAGLSDEVIRTVRQLRFDRDPYESIYVIPQERQARSSRTTYQKHSVIIPELRVASRHGGRTSVVLKKTPDGIAVVELN